MKIYGLFFPLCFFILSTLKCHSEISNKNNVIVAGKVINRDGNSPKVITIIECDPLEKENRIAIRINEQNEFKAQMEFPWGHSFTISYDTDFINVYAEVGDSIHLVIDDAKLRNKKESSILFSGDRAVTNQNFSNGYAALSELFNNCNLAGNDVSPQAFIETFKKEYNRINDSIREYCSKHQFNQEAIILLHKMAIFSMANNCIDYFNNYPKEGKDFFSNPLFDLYNLDCSKVMMFPYHVSAHFNTIIQSDSCARKFHKENNKMLFSKRITELLERLPRGRYRDVMFYKYFFRLKNNGDSIPPILPEYFENQMIYQNICSIISKESIKPESIPELNLTGDILYFSENNKIESITCKNFSDYLIKKYQGKIIYLDIWATWCGPCRVELKTAKTVHTLYKETDIVFVNICLKSDQEPWNKLVTSGEVEGDNYFFNDDASELFMSVLKVPGFPSYYLIDRSGKIMPAPRPTNTTKLCKELDNLLRNK